MFALWGTLLLAAPLAGTPDAGTPPPTGVLFSDNFNRTSPTDLGSNWNALAGAWRSDGRALSDRSVLNRAVTATVSCGDCRVEAKMVNFRGGEAVLELRASGSDRYALALTASGKLEIRLYRSGGLTVLASGASVIADLSVFHSFSFSAQGTVLVTLDATVDGVPKLSATDTSSAALTAAGAAGIAATLDRKSVVEGKGVEDGGRRHTAHNMK